MAKVGDAYIEVKPDLDNFGTSLRAQMARQDGDADKGGKNVGLRFGNAMASGIASSLGRTGALWGSIATLAGPASALVSGLSATTVSLGAALVQAGGAAAGVIPIYGTLGQTFLGVKIGLSGVADAFKATSTVQAKLAAGLKPTQGELDKVKMALQSLAPSARQFVRATLDLSKSWGGLRRSVQGALFEGTAVSVKQLATAYLPLLNQHLTQTASIVNVAARGFAAFLAAQRQQQQVGRILSGNNAILATASKAVIPLTRALLNLYETVLPLGQRLAVVFQQFAVWLDRAVQAGMKSGSLAAWFENAWKNAAILGRTVLNVGRALVSIFAAGQSDGQGMLVMLERLSKQFATWATSASGKASLQKWFAEGKQVFTQLLGLIGDLGKAFGNLAGTADASDTVKQLRSLVQPIAAVVQQLNASGTGQNLMSSITNLAATLAQANIGGSLAAFLNTINLILKPLAWLAANVPGVSQSLGVFFMVWGGYKAIALTTNALVGVVGAIGSTASAIKTGITNVAAFANGFRNVQSGASAFASTAQTMGAAVRLNVTAFGMWVRQMALSTAAMARQTAVTVAQRAATIAAAVATRVAQAAQWLWNAAMTANPIGLIVAAIALFVAGLVLAYKKVGWFRNAVNAAFKAIVVVARAAWKVVGVVVKVAVNLITVYIRTWIKVMRAVIKTGMAVVKAIMRGDWSAVGKIVSRAVQSVARAVSRGFQAVVARVRGFGGALYRAAAGLGSKIVSGIASTIRKAVSTVGNMLSSIKRAISGNSLYEAGRNLISSFISGMGSMLGGVISKAGSLVSSAINAIKKKAKIGSPSKVFIGFGKDTGLGYAIGIGAMGDTVQQAANSIVPSAGIGTLGAGALGGVGSIGQSPVQVRVYIGDREITDIVRVEVRRRDQQTAARIARGRRAV